MKPQSGPSLESVESQPGQEEGLGLRSRDRDAEMLIIVANKW